MKHVLFIDVRNTCRSRMAEGWFNRLAGGLGKAESCGTMPAPLSDPYVRQVMSEVHVTVPDRVPKGVSQQLLSRSDLVVIIGKEVSTQAFGPAFVWDLPDPVGLPLGHYRFLRDAICRNVEELIEELRSAQVTEGKLWKKGDRSRGRRMKDARKKDAVALEDLTRR